MKNIHRQQGASTLLITVVLLAVLLMVGLLSTRFQVFEQRTSANQVHATMVASVAEGAINEGLEYLKSNARFINSDQEANGSTPAGWLSTTTPQWIPCTTAVPSGEFDPCLAEVDATRRAQMYRFVSNSKTRLPLEDVLGTTQTFTKVDDKTANYNVYATLCRLDIETNPAAPACVLEPVGQSPVAITLVAHGALPGQQASSTVKSILATSRAIATPPNVPLIAAGIVSGLGSAEIIPNPNAGGFGVPLSIWTDSDVEVDSGGAFRTCHLGEWLNSNTTEQFDGITRCVKCSCKGLPPDRGLLSGKDPSTPGYEGIDIMDLDGNSNGDLPDTAFFPQEPLDDPNNNFDDSPFEYTFGVDVVNEGETTVRTDCVTDDNPSGNCENQFLLDVDAQIIADCSSLDASSTGLYWVQGNCELDSRVGTPSFPVAIIVDKCLSIKGNTEFFGLMYTRGGQAGGCANPDETLTGLGGGQIYGAIVAHGGVKIRGSMQMIYNQTVLNNLGNSPDFQRFGFLPGSWSDSVCDDDGGICK